MTYGRHTVDHGRVIAAAGLSLAAMLTVGMVSWTTAIGVRGRHSADEPLIELAFLFLFAMAVPFALVIAAVYLPPLTAVARVLGRRPVALAGIGGALGPIGILAMVTAGHFVFSHRPSIAADLSAFARDPIGSVLFVVTFMIGGALTGLGVASSVAPGRTAERECRPLT